jgi:hypothetical protein
VSSRDLPLPHPSEVELLRLSDGELTQREAALVRGHLELCWLCRSRLSELDGGIADFMQYEERVVRPLLPEPPQPWPSLDRKFRDIDAASPSSPAIWRAPKWWLAAAASIVIGILLVQHFEHIPSVSAAELLEKAARAERTLAAHGRLIRIQTRRHVITRTLPSTTVDSDELAKLFALAHYNWDDPLSAGAYLAWREQLETKQDEVKINLDAAGVPVTYSIHTSTEANVLKEATMILRAKDLHAIDETLLFQQGESIEISEIPEPVEVAAAATVNHVVPATPGHPIESQTAGPSEEVRLVAALHGIGADLGEPIEISRQASNLVVIAMGLTRARREELLKAVGKLPGVQVRFDEPQMMTAQSSPLQTARRNSSGVLSALQLELQNQLADPDSIQEVTNGVLDTSEAALARAYALRALAHRFSPEVEKQLSASDVAVLEGIRRDYLQSLSARVKDMDRQLRPALAGLTQTRPATSAIVNGPWQSRAQQIFESMQRVDQLVNALLAGSGERGNDGTPSDLAVALNRLDALL